jgi:hypothetical protein
VRANVRWRQLLPDGTSVHFERRCAEHTKLSRLVWRYAATFFAKAEDAAGAELPKYFKDQIDGFLECGILAHGCASATAATTSSSRSAAIGMASAPHAARARTAAHLAADVVFAKARLPNLDS